MPHAAGITEDPVTGSLNASLAQWLAGDVLPASYVAAQGTAIGRRGRIHVETAEDGTIWVGGDTLSTISGRVTL
ncbi:PhzF family phenazine biosynthesis protein [Nocardioides convexus]|uniref:PhzF family phenazine biosynthesis protein n=1 Tax=Nocardioides convexus TaxID=2712224 RepID=UPI002418ADE7|nr:PhzF family phenazine biosynthesis protein [Nocardioides convexus]